MNTKIISALFVLTYGLLASSQAATPEFTKGGCAWRTAALGFVEVYEICMHSGKGSPQDWQNAFSDKPSYRFKLVLDFHHDVGGKKAAKAFKDSMENHKVRNEADQADRARFFSWLEKEPLNDGSKLEMLFDATQKSAGRIIHSINGKKSKFTLRNRDAAKALASIYLGEPPFRKKIKKALLKEIEPSTKTQQGN